MGFFDHSTPQRIGDYEILRQLGGGGMAEVFLGRKVGTQGFEKQVAVKRIRPHQATEVAFVRMLIDEARIAAGLSHPNIVQIFELGEWDGSPYIVMEWVQGPSLLQVTRRLRAESQRMPPSASAYVVGAIGAALEYAHTRQDSQGHPLGIIHRDVNPANLLVSFEGEVKLIDFGIVKAAQRLHATRTGTIKGKRGYMSPEQARGDALDGRSDIFAAGLVLYELLTGTNPFQDDDELRSIERASSGTVPPPSTVAADVPPWLEEICLKAMAPDPRHRFQRAGEMAAALDAYLRKHPFSQLSFASWVSGRFRPDASERSAATDLGPATGASATVPLCPGLPSPGPAAAPGGTVLLPEETAVTVERASPPSPPLSAASVAPSLSSADQPGPDNPPVGTRLLSPPASRPVEARTARVARGGWRPGLIGLAVGVLLLAGAVFFVFRRSCEVTARVGLDQSITLPRRSPDLRSGDAVRHDQPITDVGARVRLRRRPDPPPAAATAERSRYGWLTVVTLDRQNDLWAQVFLDGRPIGTSTIFRRRTLAGEHVLAATREGFKPARRRIRLRPGVELKVLLPLRR